MAKSTKPAAAARAATPRAAKAAAPKAAADKPARAARAAAKAAPVLAPSAPITGPAAGGVMKIKELLDRVVARSGVKKKDAKPVVDALLLELGDSLGRGEGFVLPPLGRAKLGRTKEGSNGDMLVVKLKRGGAVKAGGAAEATDSPSED